VAVFKQTDIVCDRASSIYISPSISVPTAIVSNGNVGAAGYKIHKIPPKYKERYLVQTSISHHKNCPEFLQIRNFQ
jgi:hypothetical protein